MHSDLIGKIKPCSYLSGAEYIVTFKDDFSRYAMAFTMTDKTQVHITLEKYLREIRKVRGDDEGAKINIISIRTDNGTEYQTSNMNRILARENITIDSCQPYIHEHNGCAERFNLEIEQKVSVNLISAKMPFGFWGFALGKTIHIHNRTPNSSLNFKTPFEIFHGYPPKIKHICRFGCLACVHDSKGKRKFRKRGKLGFLIGCDNEGYNVYYPKEKTYARSKHVDFVESRVYGDYFGEDSHLSFDDELSFDGDEQSEVRERKSESEKVEKNHIGTVQSELSPSSEKKENGSVSKNEKREELTKELGEYLGQSEDFDVYEMEEETFEIDLDDAFVTQLNKNDMYEPYGYKEAMECADKEKLIDAMNEEYNAHDKCETWRIIDRVSYAEGSLNNESKVGEQN